MEQPSQPGPRDNRLPSNLAENNGASAETASVRTSDPRRLAKKRTKTGCLTCRKRRIKCDEFKPVCNNCIKSKRVCEGYAQRVVFKNPIGILGGYGHAHSMHPQTQHHHMRVPIINDYGSQVAAQQAVSSSQHPALASRPIEIGPMGHHPQPSSEAASHQFYYPAAQMQAPFFEPHTGHYRPDMVIEEQDQDSSWTSPQDTDVVYAMSTARAAGGPSEERNQQAALQSQVTLDTDAYHYHPSGQLPAQFYSHERHASEQNPQVIYVEDESEDYYDVDSDEEMAGQVQTEGFNQLSLIMASANQDDRQLRSFTTHLNEPNILATYRPNLGSSPLNNPKTARIFVHFIHSTGPSLSIFERHPTDASIVLGAPVPAAQQGLWTYTLALKALEHPALLQAILAVSSLHISYLQHAPTTVSLKHYHYALKRVGKAVGLPLRRKQIGTLAAALILGYYEVISADHSKWNSHVAGSAQLIREIDFAGMTQDLRAHRRRVAEQRLQMGWPNPWSGVSGEALEDDPFAEKENNIDEAFIGSIMGRAVDYDEFGRIEVGHPQAPRKYFSRKDIENFRIQCDLYWWYCKQDMIQSLISGNRLFMPYYQWGQCPPRAGIGRLDAIYGSADHLWMLLARVTDFGFRDRKRKLKALRAARTEWKPDHGMFKFMARFVGGGSDKKSSPRAPGSRGSTAGASPSGSSPATSSGRSAAAPPPSQGGSTGSPAQTATSASRDSPPMYGMIPPTGPIRLPSGFDDGSHTRESSNAGDAHEEFPYSEAETEWEYILAAFDALAHALGREFQPLPADVTPPISTPFGPALQYRTHTIAVLWGFYYAGRILLLRLHPSMPPAMMVAAGVAAPTTSEYAQIVGKITAGIYYPQRYNLEAGSLSPTLGSSLTEMTVPIFFAAVQYTDPAQRGWTIAKLRDISRLTGWKSSDSVAAGCENAWVVAAKQDRGPPYKRTHESDRRRPSSDEIPGDASNHSPNNDRRFVTVSGSDRLHWAFGILSLEDDVSNLDE